MGIVQVLEVAYDIDENVISVGEKVMDRVNEVADGAPGVFQPFTNSVLNVHVAVHRIEDCLGGLTRSCSSNPLVR
jgi:hypothetical protein